MRLLLADTCSQRAEALLAPTPVLAQRQAPVQPILCVCYTNHALDQFLEALMDAGIKDVVRAGGR